MLQFARALRTNTGKDAVTQGGDRGLPFNFFDIRFTPVGFTVIGCISYLKVNIYLK